ncbi:MAG: hypothetical protein HOM37_13200 [Acidimicrobiaceae bacterium]|jgi:hypothetical protein|nr:hypothetical protein [Acidimicrobiaceae bacterium]MBT5579355.1 hypothetical protein [Acidimicrobiaceae bacterium]
MTGADFDPDDPLAALRGATTAAEDRFVDQLDARLRVQHATGRRRVRQPLWRRVAVLAPTMVVLLVVASVVFVVRDQSPSAAFVLTDVENVTVHLPDGTSIDDPADGFELTEGARIEIRDGGMVTIDGVTVDAAAVLVVRNGELVTDIVPTTTTIDTTGTSGTRTDEDDTDDDPTRDGASDDDRAEDPEVDRSDDSDETDAQPPTTVTTVLSRPDDEPDSDSGPVDPSSASPVDVPLVEIGMRLRSVDGGVRINWSVRGADDSWSVAILRRDGDDVIEEFSTVSEILAIDSVTLVGNARQSSEGQVVDGSPHGDGPVRYGVLVVDSGGGIVASSPAQSLRR